MPGKADVASGLAEVADACALPLEGAVVVGPTGGLWTYHVITILGDTAGRARVNVVVMPHGRITGKGTGVVPKAAAAAVLFELGSSRLLAPGPVPARSLAAADPGDREFSYDLLVMRRAGDSTATWSASMRDAADTAEAARLFRRLNSLLAGVRDTYPHGDPPLR
jgi:hypothetical protein